MFEKKHLSLPIAAGLLFLFFRNIELKVVQDGIRSANWPLLAVAIAIRLLSLLGASLRWRLLVLPLKRVSLAPLFSAMMIGMSADTLIGMQSAEVIRPYLLSRWEDIPFSSTFATVMTEWLIDLLGILALLILALGSLRGSNVMPPAHVDKVVPTVLIGSLLGLGLLWLFSRHRGNIENFFNQGHWVLPKRLAYRLACEMKFFCRGLETIQRPKKLAEVFCYSLFSSFLVGLSSWTVLRAFGLSLPFYTAFIILGLISVGGLVPTPGAVGGFHTICQFGLAVFFQVEPARAILPVIGLHAVLYFPATLIGVFCAGHKGFALKEIYEGSAAASFVRQV